ncbi:MAG: hypothetical protein HY782_20855 [Chloroflexi bacterium]|nr:hypothetical protein [Chloroflexota bacterium]
MLVRVSKGSQNLIHRWAPILGLGIFTILAALAFLPFAPFYFLDDGFLHLFRLFEFDRVLRQGVPYPRWAPDFAYGYGYPVFNFYSPLAYYIAEALHLLGLAIPAALIATCVFILAIGVTGAYALGRELYGSILSGLLTAAAYGFFPYFLLDLFVRGAVAEALGAAVLPWLVWSLRRAIVYRTLSSFLLAALSAAALIVSHNLTVLLVSPFLLVFAIWEILRLPSGTRRGAFARVAAAVSLGVMLAAIYWLPTLAELPLVALSQGKKALVNLLAGSFLTPADLVQFALPYQYRDQPYPLSFLPIVLAAGALVLAIASRRGAVVLFGATALIATVLLLDGAREIWLATPFLSTVQFAWRLSVLIGLCVAVLIGSVPMAIPSKKRTRFAMVPALALILIWNGLADLAPKRLENPASDLTVAQMVRFETNTRGLGFGSQSEYLPLTVRFLANKLDAAKVDGDAPVIRLEESSATRRAFTVVTDRPTAMSWRQFYFPGWQADVGGVPALTFPTTALGLLTVNIPAGNHRVVLSWQDTLPRRAGGIVSAAGLVIVLILIVFSIRRREREWPAVLIPLGMIAGIFALTTSVALAAPARQLQPAQVDISPELRFIGLQIENASYGASGWQIAERPALLQIQPYWQVKQSLTDQPFAWRTVDGAGRVWAAREQLARYGTGFPAAWLPNEIVPDHYDLPLAGLPPGKYDLQVAYGEPRQFISVSTIELTRGSAPAPTEPQIARRVDARIGDRIRLVGYDAPAAIRAGQTLPLTLYWKAERDIFQDLTVFVQLLDTNGKLIAQHDELTANGFNPTMLWSPNAIVADKRELVLPPNVPPGPYRLIAGMYRFDDMERLPVATDAGPAPDAMIELGTVKVPMDAQAARPQRALDVAFGPAIRLAGYDLDKQNLKPGQSLALRLYWQPQARLDGDYKVFVHIVAEDGRVVTQQDSVPGNGNYPTRIWDAGEQVLDAYVLPIELPPGRYRIVAGMYNAVSGERLVAQANGAELQDRQVELGALNVLAP